MPLPKDCNGQHTIYMKIMSELNETLKRLKKAK